MLVNVLCFQEADDQLLKYGDGEPGNESLKAALAKEEAAQSGGAGFKFGWIEGVLVS